MAIYHMEAKVISRGNGRSACAASAYMSCSQIYNDYDGIQHDYTRKQGLVWQRVFLPENAPPEWQDREKLWNAVEASEKTKDSRLAREFVVALPVKLNKTQWQDLLTEFVQNQFVAGGMCANVCIMTLPRITAYLEKMKAQQPKLSSQIANDEKNFAEIRERVSSQQEDTLLDARVSLRDDSRNRVREKLRETFGQKFEYDRLASAERQIDDRLDEDSDLFRERAAQLRHEWEMERSKSQLDRGRKKAWDYERQAWKQNNTTRGVAIRLSISCIY